VQTPTLRMEGKKTTYSRKPVATRGSDRFAPTAQGFRAMDLWSESGRACDNVIGTSGSTAVVQQAVLNQPGVKLLAGYL
jgi:hypothetical protein